MKIKALAAISALDLEEMGLHVITMSLGFGGGLAVLASFAGVALGRLRPDARTYHLMNLGGALALVVSGLAVGAWPSVAVNVVWALISAAGTISARPERRRLRRSATAPC